MVKSQKILMILTVLILLFAAVSLSGCLGGKDDNATPPENVTPSENVTPPANVTPSENVTPPEVAPPADIPPLVPETPAKVVVSTSYDDESILVRIKNKQYAPTSVSIDAGETVRIWSREERNFRHILHSEEDAFEDYDLNPGFFVYLTFNEAGTYKIDMMNYYTGEPQGGSASILTVTVK